MSGESDGPQGAAGRPPESPEHPTFGSRSIVPVPVLPAGWGPAASSFDPPAPPPPPSSRRWRQRIVLVCVAAVALLGGGVYAVAGSSSNRSPAVIVQTALRRTLDLNTAALIFSGSQSVSGQSETVTGTGEIDFPDSSLDMSLYVPVNGQSLSLQVIYTAGGIYETGQALTDHSLPGKSWILIDLKSVLRLEPKAAGLFLSANPASLLPLYESKGDSVRLLGPAPKTKSATRTYAVTVPPASYQHELALLPPSAQQDLSGLAFNRQPTDISVNSRGLVDKVRIRYDLGSAVKVDETLDFSEFGADLQVSPPGSDSTMTLQQFEQASTNETSSDLQKQLITATDIGAGTKSVPVPPSQEADCFDPTPLLDASRGDQTGSASTMLEQPLQDGGEFDAFEEIAAYPPDQEEAVFSQIVQQLDSCHQEKGVTSEGDQVTLTISPLTLPMSSQTQLTPFDLDITKSYTEMTDYPDGSHGFVDLAAFAQGEKIVILYFGETSHQSAEYFLSLADTASQRMTP